MTLFLLKNYKPLQNMGLVLYAMSVMNNLSHQILGRRNCQIFFLRDDGMDLFFTKRERDKMRRVIFHKERKREIKGKIILTSQELRTTNSELRTKK